MSFEQRFALVILAGFFLASLATSLVALFAAPRVLHSRQSWTARDAGPLALFRLLPAGAAVALTLLVLAPGYLEHEQRGEPEGSGYALWLLAAGGAWVLASAATRAAIACRRTASIRRQWLAEGQPVAVAGAGMPAHVLDVPFPLVAVLGVLRPRLFISRIVLDRCSTSELTAIVEHERAHVHARDNALRLLMDATPDLLGFTPLPRSLARAWHQAVEHRADDAATRRVDLASALVKVARLATASPLVELPASALYRGEGQDLIGARVRRLVGAGSEGRARWSRKMTGSAITLGAIIAAAALTGAASRAAHALLEVTVSVLP